MGQNGPYLISCSANWQLLNEKPTGVKWLLPIGSNDYLDIMSRNIYLSVCLPVCLPACLFS